jgi:hypothetical protein
VLGCAATDIFYVQRTLRRELRLPRAERDLQLLVDLIRDLALAAAVAKGVERKGNSLKGTEQAASATLGAWK